MQVILNYKTYYEAFKLGVVAIAYLYLWKMIMESIFDLGRAVSILKEIENNIQVISEMSL